MFSEIAEIALVAARLGQFQQHVILILNFTRPMRLPIQSLIRGSYLKFTLLEQQVDFRKVLGYYLDRLRRLFEVYDMSAQFIDGTLG